MYIRTYQLGDKDTTLKWNWLERHCQYKYSAKERVDIGNYSATILWLPYLLRHLGNMHTLKLTLSCKFKHIQEIQEISLSKLPIFIRQNVFFCVLPNNTLANISSYTVAHLVLIV